MKFTKYEPGENPNPGFWVSVVCDAPSHPTKVARVADFYRGHDEVLWNVFPAKSHWVLQMIQEGREVPADEWGALQGQRARKRFSLRCPLCGDSLPVKQETISPVLDGLAQHAETWEIELTALRANLVK